MGGDRYRVVMPAARFVGLFRGQNSFYVSVDSLYEIAGLFSWLLKMRLNVF